jgi:hypothetical protein
MSATFTVPASAARELREGLHTEFGDPAEQIALIAARSGERPFEAYRQHLVRQDEARALLEQIGGETPDPPVPVEVDLSHRLVVLRALEGQRSGYKERMTDMSNTEQRRATELVQDLHTLICAIRRC